MRTTFAAAAALSLASRQAYAQLATHDEGDISYALNIPDATVSSGSGDIFFQITGPTSYSWIALGQGTSMSGANIFVIYTDSSGSNITISGRAGTGHQQPQHDASIDLALLDGSGVSNGVMTANVRCGNCQSWSGGSMDFSSSSGDWIYAYQSGDPLDSDDVSESISQHDDASHFSWDMSAGQGGSSLNPLVAASSTGGSSGGSSASGSASSVSCIPRPTSAGAAAASSGGATTTQASASATSSNSDCPPWGCQAPSWASGRPTGAPNSYHGNDKRQSVPYCDEVGSDSSNGASGRGGSSSFQNNGIPFGGDRDRANMIFMAHGIMASLAFVILFPLGGILIRVASFPGLWWIHGVFQLFAYVVYIAAFGLGVYMATELDELDNHHPIIGIVLLIVLFFQPVFGWLHHVLYKKYGHRTLWSYAHLGIGRIAVLLGMVNGGLGLQLAANASTGQITAYAVITAIMAVVYIAAIVYGEVRRRKRAPPSYDETQKGIRLSERSSEEENPAAQRENHEFYAKPPGSRS